mgnify:CR=1 FL=1
MIIIKKEKLDLILNTLKKPVQRKTKDIQWNKEATIKNS